MNFKLLNQSGKCIRNNKYNGSQHEAEHLNFVYKWMYLNLHIYPYIKNYIPLCKQHVLGVMQGYVFISVRCNVDTSK